MVRSPIYVTNTDNDKIRELLCYAENFGYRGSLHLKRLREELDRAKIVPSDEAPADLISLNSIASLFDIETKEYVEYTLVLPGQADVSRGKISILAPIGSAMLGYRVGDTFELETPGGIRKLRVEKIITR